MVHSSTHGYTEVILKSVFLWDQCSLLQSQGILLFGTGRHLVAALYSHLGPLGVRPLSLAPLPSFYIQQGRKALGEGWEQTDHFPHHFLPDLGEVGVRSGNGKWGLAVRTEVSHFLGGTWASPLRRPDPEGPQSQVHLSQMAQKTSIEIPRLL